MSKKRVGVIGASGYIGSKLCTALEGLDWSVVRISRQKRSVEGQDWRVLGSDCLLGLDALVNLAGDPIDKRWTDANKEKFRSSRVGLTQDIRKWIDALPASENLQVWLNASAVGIYGGRGDEVLTEESEIGSDYLALLCRDWENAVGEDISKGVRVVHPRIGVVLGSDGEAWRKMSRLFKWGLGGKLGTGLQWFPWVHVDDLVRGFIFCLEKEVEGGVNLVAPGVLRNLDFTRILGSKLNRPTVMTAPRFGLRILLGDFADALLASLRVSPKKLEDMEFEFQFPELELALEDLIFVKKDK